MILPTLAQIVDCPLHRRTPYGMTKVSFTQFSVARYYGGVNYGKEHYTYLPDTDELIRDDVLRWWGRMNKHAKPTLAPEQDKQGEMKL